MSAAAWTFFGVLVTNLVILIGMFRRQGKQTKSIDEVNRAVNHQAASAPTLIERVIAVESSVALFKSETLEHRNWEHRVFAALARHVGFVLPHRVPYVVTDLDDELFDIEAETEIH